MRHFDTVGICAPRRNVVGGVLRNTTSRDPVQKGELAIDEPDAHQGNLPLYFRGPVSPFPIRCQNRQKIVTRTTLLVPSRRHTRSFQLLRRCLALYITPDSPAGRSENVFLARESEEHREHAIWPLISMHGLALSALPSPRDAGGQRNHRSIL
jgi:hypothetical protein